MVAMYTLFRKEVVRFLRIWPQTLFPPIITQSLYFLIFGKFIGSQISDINGVSYMAFIVPGLVMMSVINNSYVNVAGSFFSSKFQRSVEELLVSPAPTWVIVGGYAFSGALRGVLCGLLVFAVSVFFTRPVIHHFGYILVFIVLTAVVFALGGLINGILAKKFDDISIVPTFILTPLTYLGGVFYSISLLPGVWRTISRFNPILYMINGFRYGFYGFSDVSILLSFVILILFAAIFTAVIFYFLGKGTGLRS
ncbi:MAG: ABC transporter permease [Candidatus Omnitrophica bacterium]|nr:ABC transporter permease [Candidatus Omnitrophota bacterium]MCB9721072.1 ABC transporter permease [Candidatus Omnitrophota bacterium]